MFLAINIPSARALRRMALAVVVLVGMPSVARALVRDCAPDPAPTTPVALNACIATHGTPVNSTSEDTLVIRLGLGLKFAGSQIVIDGKKNVHILGDTSDMPSEATLPFIVHQDRAHVVSDTDGIGNKTNYWEYNGALLINESRNIVIRGVGVNGSSPSDSTATANKMFAFCASYSTSACVDVKGNFGVNIRNSYGVTFRGGVVVNAWYGVGIQGRNLGGAFSYPTPLDPVSQINITLPTSRSGMYGRHLIEKNRIHDNTWGTLFEYDWDLGSIVRNNLYYNNYLRPYGVTATATYVRGLKAADAQRNTLGQQYALKWNIAGGAFFMNGVALTPYRIHNNTFNNNGVTVGAYYMAGTQHLFYNNIIGKPYQYYNAAMSKDAEASTYTQTERATEMLQFFSEHQRSNLIVPQEGAPKSTTAALDVWSQTPNFRLFRMKMNRSWNTATRNPPAPATSNWRGDAQGWSNNTSDQDSLAMTWVPDTSGTGTIAELAQEGGLVGWIRHNMYAGTYADPYDKNAETSAYGLPYMPLNIRDNLDDIRVFRNVMGHNIRWTTSIAWGSTTTPAAASFLRPLSTTASTVNAITGKGWPFYDGVKDSMLDIGALAVQGTGWSVPSARLVLQDTLIEMMQKDTVGFRMDVSGVGFTNDDIVDMKVAKAKFYYDVPVADTTFNAGGCTSYTAGKCDAGAGNDTTRVNSILSAKPWPVADSLINYNLWHLDDTLKAGKLRSTHFFIGKLSKSLPDSVYFARAEVVLQVTLKDGRTIYSNPGVFMYSRPRFQLDVVLTDENGNPLPMDVDGYSRQVIAGQKVIMHVTPKFDATSISSTVAFKDLQMGQTTLMGKDTANPSLERDSTGASLWQKIRPNQVLQPKLGRTETTTDTLRFTEAGLVGSLTLRALFDVMDQRYLQGSSKRLRVIASSIYQATIDSVFINNRLIAAPKSTVKRSLDLVAGGAGLRDTLLKAMVGTRLDSSANVSHYGEDGTGLVRLVLQVRDAFGNPVNDSVAAGLLVKLQTVSNATRFASGLGAKATELTSVQIPGTGIRAFDSTGRVVFDSITIGSVLRAGVIFPMRSMVVLGTPGNPEIGAGTARPGIPDTSWIQAAPSTFGLKITDTLGNPQTAVTGVVGTLVPIRLKVTSNGKGMAGSLTVALNADPALKYFADPSGTTPITSIATVNDSVTPVIWVRAVDTTSSGRFGATASVGTDAISANVGGNVFTFPRLRSASFHDANCDGYVDSLVLRFLDPVRFRSAAQTALSDSLDLVFPGQVLTPSAAGLAPRTTLSNDTIVTLAWDPASMGAASARANRVVLANPLGGSRLAINTGVLVDKAPPVAKSGKVSQGWIGSTYVTTVTVTFSEEIDPSVHPAGSMFPFNVKRNGATVLLDTIPTAAAVTSGKPGDFTWTVHGRINMILPNDSMIVSGKMIRDPSGNTTGDLCANNPFGIIVITGAIPENVTILDFNGDGNGDHLRVTYRDSIGALPETFFVRWGTPAETLTVTSAMLIAQGVKSSDTGFTLAFTSWKGQNVTVGGDVVRAPRTVGPADTATFYGGAVQVRIRDGIAPVLIHAQLIYDTRIGTIATVDTLRLTFSENIAGCPAGTSPNSCLDLKTPSASGLKFPDGSSVIGVKGDVMLIAVPSNGPNVVSPGDSLRALAASKSGLVTDATWDNRANGPGDSASWIVIRADRRPPSLGWFFDENGDGKVDGVVLEYNKAPDPTIPELSFAWAGKTRSGSTWEALDAGKLRWKVSFATPFDTVATGDALASSRPAGIQVGNVTRTNYGFFVYDSVGAVLRPGAKLNPGTGKNPTDTVMVEVSEPLLDPTAKILVAFRHGSRQIPDDSVRIESVQRIDALHWRVVIASTSPWRPSNGDSVRLSVTGSVHDTTRIGMVPHVKHPWVLLSGAARAPYDAAYFDRNGDGRIDTWIADFVVPPAVGTIFRVLDPAGSGTFLLDTVKYADSGRTHFEYPVIPNWAQDVTSLVTPDLGRLNLPGSSDTTKFSIRDGVPPVIKEAYLGYTSDTTSVDTLRIRFSEKVDVDVDKFVLVWKLANGLGDSTLIKPVQVLWDPATQSMVLLLKPMPGGTDADKRPEKGDLVRILDNGAVKDTNGNTPDPVAKWTLVSGSRRIFPPKLGLTNNMVYLDPSKADPNEPDLDVVWRKPMPGTDANNAKDWSHYEGGGGKLGASYGLGSDGTILHLETNVPTSLAIYIYDLAGTYVTAKQISIEQKDIDRLNASLGNDSVRASTINMIDVGFKWKGRAANGKFVGTGIYVVRIIAFRGPTPEERSLGASGIQATNYLQKIGVKAKKE